MMAAVNGHHAAIALSTLLATRIEWIVFVLMSGVVGGLWIALRDESTWGWWAIAILIVASAAMGVVFAVDPPPWAL